MKGLRLLIRREYKKNGPQIQVISTEMLIRTSGFFVYLSFMFVTGLRKPFVSLLRILSVSPTAYISGRNNTEKNKPVKVEIIVKKNTTVN